jgi:hypothetical protein
MVNSRTPAADGMNATRTSRSDAPGGFHRKSNAGPLRPAAVKEDSSRIFAPGYWLNRSARQASDCGAPPSAAIAPMMRKDKKKLESDGTKEIFCGFESSMRKPRGTTMRNSFVPDVTKAR